MMKKHFVILLFVLLPCAAVFAQVRSPRLENRDNNTRERRGALDNAGQNQRGVISKKEKPPISDYKVITVHRDTTIVDTSLSIQKEYRFNYLRKDNFELLEFSNVGQTYNRLSYNFHKNQAIVPGFGARGKHFNFFEVEDINYYRVPTPLTELYFKTAQEQGQQLDAFFTVNTHPNLNFSVAYKGVRSLGRYQNNLTSTGNFRSTINYHATNNRYRAKAHFVSQDIFNEENGGLQATAIDQYLSGQEEYEDRALLDVNFTDASTLLLGKRFYLNHFYQINGLANNPEYQYEVGHILDFTDKKYRYEQASPAEIFGASFQSSGIRDEVNLEHIYNEGFLKMKNQVLGELSVKAGFTKYNYGYNSIVNFGPNHIPNRLIGDIFSAGAGYRNTFGGFQVDVDAMKNVVGDLDGHVLSGTVSYAINEDNLASVGLLSNSAMPNFNFLLYQSDYINYNWHNGFQNQKTNSLHANLNSTNIANVEASYSQINDYTYFGLNEEGLVRPEQANQQVDFFKLKIGREFSYGKFALDNTILYQEVLNGDEVMNLPNLVSRNSLYFSDHLFQRALFLQTGFIFKYFTNYKMDGYDPVLSEFFVQNQQEIEGFPTVDFFVNARIRQTRIFFKLEHLNAALTGNTNFSAPGYPDRDFSIRFGLVWNFFL